MIRYKDVIIESYHICPITGKIFNEKTGHIQETIVHQGYEEWRGMGVHRLQAHTYLKYFKGCEVHHIDKNPLNNCILNLKVLTKEQHLSEERTGKNHPMYGKHISEEARSKITLSLLGKPSRNKGHHFSEESRRKLSIAHKGKMSGFHWFNNGFKNVFCKDCPRRRVG